MLEPHKQAEIDSRTEQFMAHDATKPFGWGGESWVKWATIAEAFARLGVARGARVLDVGVGSGWTSALLAESGYAVTAVDLVPANVAAAQARADRWDVDVDARVADMDALALDVPPFQAVLVFDALHHSTRPDRVVANLAGHVAPGGWVLFGEPSLLHAVSPHARAVSRDLGWTERGVGVRRLRRACRAAGLTESRRFFEGGRPYASRGREFAVELVRLVAANVAVAPRTHVWLAAGRPAVAVSGIRPRNLAEER